MKIVETFKKGEIQSDLKFESGFKKNTASRGEPAWGADLHLARSRSADRYVTPSASCRPRLSKHSSLGLHAGVVNSNFYVIGPTNGTLITKLRL